MFQTWSTLQQQFWVKILKSEIVGHTHKDIIKLLIIYWSEIVGHTHDQNMVINEYKDMRYFVNYLLIEKVFFQLMDNVTYPMTTHYLGSLK